MHKPKSDSWTLKKITTLFVQRLCYALPKYEMTFSSTHPSTPLLLHIAFGQRANIWAKVNSAHSADSRIR